MLTSRICKYFGRIDLLKMQTNYERTFYTTIILTNAAITNSNIWHNNHCNSFGKYDPNFNSVKHLV